MHEIEREHRWHKFGALLAFLFALAILPASQYLLQKGQTTHRELGEVAGVSTSVPVSPPAVSQCDQQQTELAQFNDAANKGAQALLAEYQKAVAPYEAAKLVLTGTEASKAQESAALDELIAGEYQQYQAETTQLNAHYEGLRHEVMNKSCR